MKVEVKLDEHAFATDGMIERIVKEVVARLDEKIGTMVMEKVDEALDEALDDRVELGIEEMLKDMDIIDDPLLEEVTVITPDPTGVNPKIKTCTKLETIIDAKIEDMMVKVIEIVMDKVQLQHGKPLSSTNH